MMTTDVLEASHVCATTANYISAVTGGVLSYDASIFGYDWYPLENMIDEFFNNARKSYAIYKAIHIYDSPKRPYF